MLRLLRTSGKVNNNFLSMCISDIGTTTPAVIFTYMSDLRHLHVYVNECD